MCDQRGCLDEQPQLWSSKMASKAQRPTEPSALDAPHLWAWLRTRVVVAANSYDLTGDELAERIPVQLFCD